MSDNRANDTAAITAVLESLYKAWDAGDADAFVADYTQEATAIMPGSYRASREEVRQGMAAGFASFLKPAFRIIQRHRVTNLWSDLRGHG
ncbi:YybH family protein [Streptomyces mirabilis]|uniref:YybH family protein n=1 Tax=Streptomyces mirabilis TaxID=68239 RepID=UPI002256A5A8|nr:SgcJ/EcaC family oxidoreductase [Streptomyces mirabilis]MCX4615700.1 SgcJ/EcaC family oxidoreductase [Streptomyces mirabilis]